MIRSRSVLVAALAALAIAAPASLTIPAQAATYAGSPGRAAPAVAVTGTNSPFSPNGDGSKDRGAVTYHLAKRAYVTVRITAGTSTVLTTKPVRVAKGNHTFVWDGKRAGRVVSDGTYTITVTSSATKHGRARAASTRLAVDARYGSDNGTVLLSSGAVYPRTTVIHDVLVGNFFAGDHFFTGKSETSSQYRTALEQVVDVGGRVIDSARLDLVEGLDPYGSPNCYEGCGRFTWDGRTSRGAIAPAGIYRIRVVRGTDQAGNPRVMAPPVTVRVSTSLLTRVTRTRSFTASTPERVGLYDTSCNGCSDVITNATTSTRFEGGRSYDAFDCYTKPCIVVDRFFHWINGRRTPSDSFSVTAHGGPTTPGGTDTGSLIANGTVVPMTGDTVATVSVPFAPNTEVPVPDVPSPGLRWSFQTTGSQSYDLASFDITWTMYEPAS